MKKITSLLLTALLLTSGTVFADDYGEYIPDDPFNNDLFEVVAEVNCGEYFIYDFEDYKLECNEDGTLAKVVRIDTGYDGSVTVTDLCDFMDYKAADELYYSFLDNFDSEPTYNDGLIHCRDDEECYLGGYKDITGTIRFNCPTWDYFNYYYNIGLLCEESNNGYVVHEIDERTFTTTFTALMTDGMTYSFECKINPFNDDGYSLLENDNRLYVIKLKKGIIPTVFYNGAKIAFDQIPIIENGRTLVPLRAIFETIGAEVQWDADTNSVTASKNGIEIRLTVDSTNATKNGEAISLDVPAKIVNGRTLVPVRFISDCFDIGVEWDDVMKRVSLTE